MFITSEREPLRTTTHSGSRAGARAHTHTEKPARRERRDAGGPSVRAQPSGAHPESHLVAWWACFTARSSGHFVSTSSEKEGDEDERTGNFHGQKNLSKNSPLVNAR